MKNDRTTKKGGAKKPPLIRAKRSIETGQFISPKEARSANYQYLWQVANEQGVSKERIDSFIQLAKETWTKDKKGTFKAYFKKYVTAWRTAQTKHTEKIEARYLDRFLNESYKIDFNGKMYDKKNFLLGFTGYYQKLPKKPIQWLIPIEVDEKKKIYTIRIDLQKVYILMKKALIKPK